MVFHRFLEGAGPTPEDLHQRDQRHLTIARATLGIPSRSPTTSRPRNRSGMRRERRRSWATSIKHKAPATAEAEYEQAAGPGGWNGQQGFYVYRNDRHAACLGLAWGSGPGARSTTSWPGSRSTFRTALTPSGASTSRRRRHTRRPACACTSAGLPTRSVSAHTVAGVYCNFGEAGFTGGPTAPITRAWKPVTENGRTLYRIDRTHPLVASALASAGAAGPAMQTLLRVLEETVPVQQIWLDATEHPEQQARPLETAPPAEVEELIRQTLARAATARSASCAGPGTRPRHGTLQPVPQCCGGHCRRTCLRRTTRDHVERD